MESGAEDLGGRWREMTGDGGRWREVAVDRGGGGRWWEMTGNGGRWREMAAEGRGRRAGFWLRKKPFGSAISPGEKALTCGYRLACMQLQGRVLTSCRLACLGGAGRQR